jgi:hypothetical protein
MIAVMLGLGYAAAVVIAPDGMLARGTASLRLSWRVVCEDVLAEAWRAEEGGNTVPSSPRGGLPGLLAGWWLKRRGRLLPDGRLTAKGRGQAEMVVRSHRLWETWLGRHVRLPLDHLHPPAKWIEHYLGAAMRQRLEEELAGAASGPTAADPHGSAIPPER